MSRLSLITWSLALLTAPAEASPLPWADAYLGATAEDGRPDDQVRRLEDGRPDRAGFLTPRRSDEALHLYLGAGLELALPRGMSAAFGVDTGLIRLEETPTVGGEPLGESLATTGGLRALSLTAPLGPLEVRLGRTRLAVAEGLFFDELVTGGELGWSGEAFSLSGGVYAVGRELLPEGGLLTQWVGRYQPSFEDELFVLFATLKDGGAGAEALATSLLDLALLRAVNRADEADLYWSECATLTGTLSLWVAGVGGEAQVGDGRLSGVVLVEGGEGTFSPTPLAARPQSCDWLERRLTKLSTTREYALRSAAAQLNARFQVTPKLWLGAYAVYLMGEPGEDGDDFEAYVAPAPLLAQPALMVGSGLGQGLGGQSAQVAGVVGKGLFAPGATALFVPWDPLELSLAMGPLFADEPRLASHSQVYGVEVDLGARLTLGEVVLEGRLEGLNLGAFYPEEGLWWRASLGALAHWP